jgi:phage/plasmid-like protein (TIGR03299 family)
MSALFESGFFVRKPAWHGLGVVLQEFPGREEAMRLAGHDFTVMEVDVGCEGKDIYDPSTFDGNMVRVDGVWKSYDTAPGKKGLYVNQMKDGVAGPLHGNQLALVNRSLGLVQNEVCWDILEAIVDSPNVHYETGGTLEGGASCFATAWLDEPIEIDGDDSPMYPFAAVNWRHDGLGAIKALGTTVREVCANTVAMAESEAEKSGRLFTFRHTKNVKDRIADAKLAIRGISEAHMEFAELANELARITFTEAQREEFVQEFIPTPPESLISKRVQTNIDEARGKVRGLLLSSPTIPDAHRLTGWGMYNAGVEYLDHLRGYRNSNTYVGRTLLRPEPLKAKLLPMIERIAA